MERINLDQRFASNKLSVINKDAPILEVIKNVEETEEIMLKQLDLNQFIRYITDKLEIYMKSRDYIKAIAVLEQYNQYNLQADKIHILCYMFAANVNVNLLKFLSEAYKLGREDKVTSGKLLFNGVMILRDLIKFISDQHILLAISHLTYIYPSDFNLSALSSLYDYAKQQNNSIAENAILSLISTKTGYAEVPPWIINIAGSDEEFIDIEVNKLYTTEIEKEYIYTLPYENELIVPKVSTNTYTQMNNDELVDILLKRKRISINQEEYQISRDHMLNKITTMNSEELDKLKKKTSKNAYLSTLQDDPSYFNILGPANPFSGSELLITEDECNKYGGCRMFFCRCREHYNEEDDEEIFDDNLDWFLGYCMYCRRKIRNRYHAVRIPYVSGGWRGCYCSIDCLLDLYTEMMEEAGSIEPPTTDGLIKTLNKKLIDSDNGGIQDRKSITNTNEYFSINNIQQID